MCSSVYLNQAKAHWLVIVAIVNDPIQRKYYHLREGVSKAITAAKTGVVVRQQVNLLLMHGDSLAVLLGMLSQESIQAVHMPGQGWQALPSCQRPGPWASIINSSQDLMG